MTDRPPAQSEADSLRQALRRLSESGIDDRMRMLRRLGIVSVEGELTRRFGGNAEPDQEAVKQRQEAVERAFAHAR